VIGNWKSVISYFYDQSLITNHRYNHQSQQRWLVAFAGFEAEFFVA
jgi:hypothetical protein